MGLKQQQVGKSFEKEILDYYASKNWWSFKIPTEFNGTICDIILAKNGGCMFIECKHTTEDKLYYKGSGIYKKRDELDNFVKKYNCNIYIMIKSDKLGCYWTTWVRSKDTFEKQGYLDLEKDCFKADLEIHNENNIK